MLASVLNCVLYIKSIFCFCFCSLNALQSSEQASLAGELGFALQFTDFSSYLQSFPSISVTSYKPDCPPTIILHDMRWGEKGYNFVCSALPG